MYALYYQSICTAMQVQDCTQSQCTRGRNTKRACVRLCASVCLSVCAFMRSSCTYGFGLKTSKSKLQQAFVQLT